MDPTLSIPEPTTQDPTEEIQYVPSETWQQVVDFYTVALNQRPQYPSQTEAVFQLPGGRTLRIIATNDSGLLAPKDPTLYLNLRDLDLLKTAYEQAQKAGAEVVISLQTIDIFPVPATVPSQSGHLYLTLACLKFREKSLVAAATEIGLVHNPNW